MTAPLARRYLAMLVFALPHVAQATPPPPIFVELTPALIKELGFEIQVSRRDGFSSVELAGPARIGDALHAHSTEVTTRDLKGRIRQFTRNGTRLTSPSVASRFDHRQVDISISIGYCEVPVQACVDYGLESASAFIRKHAKPHPTVPGLETWRP